VTYSAAVSDCVQRLQHFAQAGNLSVFLGAGASSVAPTCLPTWWHWQDALVKALGDQAGKLCGPNRTREWTDLVRSHQNRTEGRLPPEFMAETIATRFPETYFDVLQCLDSEVPNEVHLTLAALARAGRLKAIVTTNFDRTVEQAFANAAVPLEIHFRPEDFAKLAHDLETFSRDEAPCQLLKIHGSAAEPKTLIDTLSQRRRGFSSAIAACLRHLLHSSHWLFLGYSGFDLDADGDYLFLRSEAESGLGLTWLVRDGVQPPAAVSNTIDLYGGRADIVYGVLPEWLRPLVAGLPMPAAPSADSPSSLVAAETAVVTLSASWAAARGSLWCGIVLSDLLLACGLPDQALDLLAALECEVKVDQAKDVQGALFEALGSLSKEQGKYEEALDYYRRSLKSIEGLAGGEILAGVGLYNMAVVVEKTGRLAEALRLFEESLAICERLGHLPGKAAALMGIAAVYFHRGETSQALQRYGQCLAVKRELGDEPGEASVLNNLGNVHLWLGETDEAIRLLEEALRLRKRLGDAPGEASTLDNIAAVYSSRGERQAALSRLQDSCLISKRLGDRPSLARALSNMGQVLLEEGRRPEASERFHEALSICEGIRAPALKAAVLVNLSASEYHDGLHHQALQHLKVALSLYEGLGRERDRGSTLKNMGVVYDALGDFKTALDCYQEALKIQELTDDNLELALTHLNMGALFLNNLHRPMEGLIHFLAALERFERMGSPYAAEAREGVRLCRQRI
jgi:tetratricopeptide (TPR) repeat protein